MKILIVRNTAGALSPVANWLVKQGHEVRMIENKERDRFGRVTIFPSVELFNSWRDGIDALVDIIKEWKPDIIHINSHVIYLIVARAANFTVPILFQFHGTDIRGKKIPREANLADIVVVSTPDLERKELRLLPCAISDFFEDKGGRIEGTALLIVDKESKIDYSIEANEYCENQMLKIDVMSNVPHRELPKLLSKYEFYLDFKGLDAYSKLAFEAHACGCKIVHRDSYRWIREVPHHDMEYWMGHPEHYLREYQTLRLMSKFRYIRIKHRVSNIFNWLFCMTNKQNIFRGAKALKRRVFG